MAFYNAGDVVTVTAPRGAGLLLAIFRLVSVSGENLELCHLRGAPLREFVPRDRVSLLLETAEASLQATAVVTDVRPPDGISIRVEGTPVERPRRRDVRIDACLGLEYEIRKGDERSVVEEFRRKASLRPGARLLPPARSVPGEEGDPAEEREREILRIVMGVDLKIDAIAKFLAEGERKALRMFTPQWVNLSASGLRFVAPEEVAAGDFVEVRLFLPDGSGLPVAFLGVAVRAEPSSRGGGAGTEVAVEYRCLDECDKDRIARFIHSRQREGVRLNR